MGKQPDILVRFGNRLRQLRQERGLSQESFADECGLDRTYVSGVERGKRNDSLRNIVALARALKSSPSQLLEGIDLDNI